MPVNNLIQLRRGNFTTWSSQDTILSSGEPGYDLTSNILKIGDGVTSWLHLLPTASSDCYLYAKNTTGSSLTKGQAVYINDAQGNNPTIRLSIASNESGSSKTIGLLKQDLIHNAFGYVVTEGTLEGINTSLANNEGDTMWLSPVSSGGIIYGTANRPSAPNHMVFLGYVLRKQLNNGKVYVKIQNGYELQELHNVAVSDVTNGQFLQYSSSSGLWLASSSGNFTSLSINNTGVSISGHTHTSSNITNFNSSVSGLLPVKDIVPGNNITVSSVSGTYTINSTGGGGSAELVYSYATEASFPNTGDATLLYFATDTGRMYRWTGSVYVEVGTVGGGDSFSWAAVPTSSAASGTEGQIARDTNYFYVCYATDAWKRVLLYTFGTFTAIPLMTSASTPSGVASASAILAAGLEAWKAFNKLTVTTDDNFYASPSPATDNWVQYDYGTGNTSRIGGYTITSRNSAQYGDSSSGSSQAPVAWTFAGSNDNTSFVTLDTRTNQSFTQGQVRTFTLSAPAEYRVYRWTWTESPVGSAVVVPKIQLVL
jgi:hypothetical protein